MDKHVRAAAAVTADSASTGERRTERLLLRRWQPGDADEMARINRHPEVGRYLNRPVDDAAVAAFHGLMIAHWDSHGFGPWALESLEPATRGRLLGFAGLAFPPPFLAAAGPAPELGWRLDPACWGQGLATEAAIAARDHAFTALALPEVISIIHPANTRSQRVAAKLGMTRSRQIDNPALGIKTDIWHLPALDRRQGKMIMDRQEVRRTPDRQAG
jgi:RimJ/RimL family protein N-acetyltransferase